MAAERAALQRQILLLQNLIDRHKSLHGNTPVPGSQDQTRTNPTSTVQTSAGSTVRTNPRSTVHSSVQTTVHSSVQTTVQTTAGSTVRTNPRSTVRTALTETRPVPSSSSSSAARGLTAPLPLGADRTWRKTYSLKNDSSKTVSAHRPPSAASASTSCSSANVSTVPTASSLSLNKGPTAERSTSQHLHSTASVRAALTKHQQHSPKRRAVLSPGPAQNPTVPKFKHPTVPEFKHPTVPEFKHPTVPEFKHPTVPEFKHPTVPEFKQCPTVPEFKHPTVPEFKQRPTVPEFKQRPTVPEFKQRRTVPEFKHPTVPEFKHPTVPKAKTAPESQRKVHAGEKRSVSAAVPSPGPDQNPPVPEAKAGSERKVHSSESMSAALSSPLNPTTSATKNAFPKAAVLPSTKPPSTLSAELSVCTIKDVENRSQKPSEGNASAGPGLMSGGGAVERAPPAVSSGSLPPVGDVKRAPPAVSSGSLPPVGDVKRAPPAVSSGLLPSVGDVKRAPPAVSSGLLPSVGDVKRAPPAVSSGSLPSVGDVKRAPPAVSSGSLPSGATVKSPASDPPSAVKAQAVVKRAPPGGAAVKSPASDPPSAVKAQAVVKRAPPGGAAVKSPASPSAVKAQAVVKRAPPAGAAVKSPASDPPSAVKAQAVVKRAPPAVSSGLMSPDGAVKMKRVPPAGGAVPVKRLRPGSPGSVQTQSKFTWVRAGPERSKEREGTAGGAGSGPIRRSCVSALSKASSRYRWVSRVQRAEPGLRPGLRPGPRAGPKPGPKAGPRPGLRAAPVSPKASLGPRGCSRFRWSAPRRTEAATGSAAVETGSVAMETRGSTGFKLRSRTKIIRRSSPSEVQTPCGPKPGLRPRSGPGRTLVSKHRLRRISPGPSDPASGASVSRTSPKDLVSVSRTSPKDLVSVSRHKLRRMSCKVQRRVSPVSAVNRSSCRDLVSVSRHRLCRSRTSLNRTRTRTRTGSGLGLTLTPGRGFSSRFKTDNRNATPTAATSLQPRRHRLQSNRSVPQARLRSLSTAPPPGCSHMCWIRGSLFSVSANSLSRATPTQRTGPAPLSRHLARGALQRSLAVARSSLKKRQREFCVFYNRFGRCNRGAQCRYIHDPDKVAVCTRFLRGRCKEGDNCPFSHKVSKDKMPVCSFFLRGRCLNAECPYSHVYVSRKAQVCDDFLRGYCPQGLLCKKRHTLICPNPDCLRGDTCKLQHKRPIRRSPAKKTRPHTTRATAQSPGTPDPAADPPLDLSSAPPTDPAAVPPAVPQKLPSFISLCSSPEEPDPLQTPGGAVLSRGRTLQIKPRLNLNS